MSDNNPSEPSLSTNELSTELTKHNFLGFTAAKAAVIAAIGSVFFASRSSAHVHDEAYVPPSATPVTDVPDPLPWATNALEPTISIGLISLHYEKHHTTYLANLNNLLTTPALTSTIKTLQKKLKGKTLEEIIMATHRKKDATGIAFYQNASQVYNHIFFWNSIKPNGGGLPTGSVAEQIIGTFGNYETFKAKFIDAAVGQFGTGWAWLVIHDQNKLQIVTTADADTPFVYSSTPLLSVDVWEHAYYLDYQNDRRAYVTAVVENLWNWDFANENLG